MLCDLAATLSDCSGRFVSKLPNSGGANAAQTADSGRVPLPRVVGSKLREHPFLTDTTATPAELTKQREYYPDSRFERESSGQ